MNIKLMLREFAKSILSSGPKKLSPEELHPAAYKAGYESGIPKENPHLPGSIFYRSWDQGCRDKVDLEVMSW